MRPSTLFVNNTNVIEVRSLRDPITTNLVTDASVTMTIRDESDVPVPGITWPITLNHTANAIYRGYISKDAQFNYGERYIATIVATSGSGQAEWKKPYVAIRRKGC